MQGTWVPSLVRDALTHNAPQRFANKGLYSQSYGLSSSHIQMWERDHKQGCCCCSVPQSCCTLCNPMDCSKPGFPVLHCLLEFAQTHIHWLNDAIQPSHPLLPPSPLVLSLYSIRVFSNESAFSLRWPKYWSFSFSISTSNEYSGLISFRIDWFDLLAVQGTLKSLP